MSANLYALRMRLGEYAHQRDLTSQEIDQRLNAMGYLCPRGTWARVMSGRKQVDQRMIITLSLMFDLPRRSLISDPGYNSLPE